MAGDYSGWLFTCIQLGYGQRNTYSIHSNRRQLIYKKDECVLLGLVNHSYLSRHKAANTVNKHKERIQNQTYGLKVGRKAS